jgi:hypothetical protein
VTATGAKGTSLELSLASGSGTARVDAWAIAQWAVARGGTLPVVAVSTPDRSWSRTDEPNHWSGSGAGRLAPGHVIVQVA